MPSPAPRLFGTDGVRGPAGEPPLDAESLTRFGRALGRHLGAKNADATVILGGDTRASTPEICAWLASALEETGCRPAYGGTLPTPAVARLTAGSEATIGIAVSASHNPYQDNGVKLIDGDGFKWARSEEAELEARFANEPALGERELSRLSSLAPPPVDDRLRTAYLAALAELFPGRPLDGLSIVLDAANGAASEIAGPFFAGLGAQVRTLGDRPDGTNINRNCGSTVPGLVAAATVETGADLGFAFDGDADRVLASDESGAIHDGDAMLYVLANALAARGELVPPRIAVTSMSNLGLGVALAEAGIEIVRTDVGDRAVVEALRAGGLLLGGEQSGHLIHLGLASTGDGLLSAALLATSIASSGDPLSRLAAGFRRFPQILRNVEVPAKPDLATLPGVVAAARRVEETLGDKGRLVLRYSGTEPLARVMLEGPNQDDIEELAEILARTIAAEIGALEG